MIHTSSTMTFYASLGVFDAISLARSSFTDMNSRVRQRDGSFRGGTGPLSAIEFSITFVANDRTWQPVGARRLNDAVGVGDIEPTSQLDLQHLMHCALEQIESTVAPQTWRAFWTCVVDGQSADVVANELDMTAATTHQARSRVLRRLRE